MFFFLKYFGLSLFLSCSSFSLAVSVPSRTVSIFFYLHVPGTRRAYLEPFRIDGMSQINGVSGNFSES